MLDSNAKKNLESYLFEQPSIEKAHFGLCLMWNHEQTTARSGSLFLSPSCSAARSEVIEPPARREGPGDG